MAERGDWIHGATIDKQTRALRFTSVSQINTADTKDDGCPRKWAYAKLDGIKEPETGKQKRGTEGHRQIEEFARTGDARKIGPEVATGLHIVPDPGPDLHLEWDVLKWPSRSYPDPLTRAHSRQLLADAPVKLAGVSMTGFIDLWHRRGTNKGGADVRQTRDPEGTVEVTDWKFTGDATYWKSEHELVKMTQLASYGEWAFTVMPDAPAVRLSLGYFPARKARPTKVSKLVRREDVQPQVDHAAGVVRLLQHVAREKSAATVEANTLACDKYGGCFYRGRCDAPMKKTFAAMVGQTAAAEAMAKLALTAGNFVPLDRVRSASMSILKQSQSKVPPPPIQADVAAEQLRIADAERRARLQARVPQGFAAAVVRVNQHGRGFPALAGAAAAALWALEGEDRQDERPGDGEIKHVKLESPADMETLADELDAELPPISGLPPDAPASDPAKAADQPAEAEDAGEDAPAAPAPKPVAAKTPAATKAKAPARTKLVQYAVTLPAQEEIHLGVITDEDVRASNARRADVQGAATLRVYVNCDTSVECKSLDAWAMGLVAALEESSGVRDLRSAEDDSVLAFGKWRGALAAMTREAPLPGGAYSLRTYGSELLSVVAEALCHRALAAGGSFTRGS